MGRGPRQEVAWWSWEWQELADQSWYKKPVGPDCRKCAKGARSFPNREAEDVIQQALSDPQVFGVAFRRLTEVGGRTRDQFFFPCSVSNTNFIYLDTSINVDIVDTSTFASKMPKPAQAFAASKSIETTIWPFIDEHMEKDPELGVVAVEAGTVPAGLKKRPGKLGYRSEVKLEEFRLRPEDQLRKEQAVEVFQLEKKKALANRSGIYSKELLHSKVLSWDKWHEKCLGKEADQKKREEDALQAWKALQPGEGAEDVAPPSDVAVSGAEHHETLDLFGDLSATSQSPARVTMAGFSAKGKSKSSKGKGGGVGGKARRPSGSPEAPRSSASAADRSRTPPSARVGSILAPAGAIKSEAAALPADLGQPVAAETVGDTATSGSAPLVTQAGSGLPGRPAAGASERPRPEPKVLSRQEVWGLFAKSTGEDNRIMAPARPLQFSGRVAKLVDVLLDQSTFQLQTFRDTADLSRTIMKIDD